MVKMPKGMGKVFEVDDWDSILNFEAMSETNYSFNLSIPTSIEKFLDEIQKECASIIEEELSNLEESGKFNPLRFFEAFHCKLISRRMSETYGRGDMSLNEIISTAVKIGELRTKALYRKNESDFVSGKNVRESAEKASRKTRKSKPSQGDLREMFNDEMKSSKGKTQAWKNVAKSLGISIALVYKWKKEYKLK